MAIFLGCLMGLPPTPQTGEIRGQVVDGMGAAIANAGIRVLDAKTRATIARAQSGAEGRFEVRGLTPASYVLAVAAKGFTEKLVDTQTAANSTVQLDVLDCDAPGVNCDIISTGPYSDPHPVVVHRNLTVNRDNTVDLDNGKLAPAGSAAADFRLIVQDSGLFLTPLNGAAIARASRKDDGCAAPREKLPPVRVDGLGAGSAICVRTRTRHCGRIFVTKEIEPGAQQIELYVVTRK